LGGEVSGFLSNGWPAVCSRKGEEQNNKTCDHTAIVNNRGRCPTG